VVNSEEKRNDGRPLGRRGELARMIGRWADGNDARARTSPVGAAGLRQWTGDRGVRGVGERFFSLWQPAPERSFRASF